VATSAYSAYQPPFVTWRWQGSSLLSGACGRCFHCGRCAASCRQGRLAGTLPAGRFWGGQAVMQAGVAGTGRRARPVRRTLRLRASHLQRSRPVSGKVIVTAEPVVIHPRRRRDRGVPERRRGAAGDAGPPSRTRAGHGETTSLFVASSCDRCWATQAHDNLRHRPLCHSQRIVVNRPQYRHLRRSARKARFRWA
jgi:ferredoxin